LDLLEARGVTTLRQLLAVSEGVIALRRRQAEQFGARQGARVAVTGGG